MHVTRFLLPLLVPCTAPLAAQLAPPAADTVHVGSARIHADRLATRADTLELWVRGRGGRQARAGILVLRTELPEGFGPRTLERRETLHLDGVPVEETVMRLDSRSLEPVGLTIWSDERETESIGFYDGGAHGWREVDGRRATVDDTLPRPRFLSASMDLLLAALPLSAGAAFVLPVWDDEEGSGWAAVRVAGLESLLGAGRQAWRVEVEGVSSAGTYWLDRESHALVQYRGAAYRLVRPSRARRSGATDTDR